MKLSISNIAWLREEDNEVYEIMRENGFVGLDMPPARIFDNPFSITIEDVNKFNEKINEMGIELIGMQSLLYGTEGLHIFRDKASREKTFEYLKKMVDYGQKIGIKVLVFGSPKNRIIGDMEKDESEKIAIDFFERIGSYALERGMYFCIEPNPKEYGTDFITRTKDGIDFVKKVNNDGFKLHFDMGTSIMNNEDLEEIFKYGIDIIKHIHISQPFLNSVCKDEEKHIELANVLKKFNYNGFVAIEMRNSITNPNSIAVKDAIEFIARIYGGNINE